MTVGELETRMTSAELVEWMALYQIEASEREHAQKVSKSRSASKGRR